jgi:zinc protease
MTPTIPTILEASHDVPIVEIRHIFPSGTALEPAERSGVGRIALRLLRRGVAGLGRRELDEAVDRIAAVISAQATPDFYALHVRALEKYIDRATDLFARVLLEPALEVEELERLKRETVAEIVSDRDDDRHLASAALRRLVFEDHPYGRASHGSLETVRSITIDDVRELLATHLVASNVVVGAAGDVDSPRLERAIERTVGRLPGDVVAPAPSLAPKTPHRGVRVALVDKPSRTQTQIFVGHLGPAIHDPLDLPLRVALTAFGGTFTSRLMQEVRVKRGWSYGAYASLGRGRLPDILSLWAFPAVKDAVPCLELLVKLYRELREAGPGAAEVAFARDYLARGHALQRDTASARLTLRLRQRLLGMPEDYYDTFAERVRAVTDAQANEAVARHTDSQNLAIAITCTADEIRDDLRRLLGDDATFETIPYDSPDL